MPPCTLIFLLHFILFCVFNSIHSPLQAILFCYADPDPLRGHKLQFDQPWLVDVWERGSCQSVLHPVAACTPPPTLAFILGFPRSAVPGFSYDHLFVLHTLPVCLQALLHEPRVFALGTDWVETRWPPHIPLQSKRREGPKSEFIGRAWPPQKTNLGLGKMEAV